MEQALRVVVLGVSVLLLSWLLLAFMAKRLPPGTAKKRILTRLIGARHRSPRDGARDGAGWDSLVVVRTLALVPA